MRSIILVVLAAVCISAVVGSWNCGCQSGHWAHPIACRRHLPSYEVGCPSSRLEYSSDILGSQDCNAPRWRASGPCCGVQVISGRPSYKLFSNSCWLNQSPGWSVTEIDQCGNAERSFGSGW